MKTVNDIKIILFDKNNKESIITKKFLLHLKDRHIIDYSNEDELKEHIVKLQKEGYRSKEVLILKRFMGRFFQLCPGTPKMICCNYRVINTCFNCLYNCAYCYLNTYLNSYGILQFTNIENVFGEIENFLSKANPETIYRIGSGEFTDSLMMDEITGIGRDLIKKLNSFENVMLELKTKSSNIDHLLEIKEKGNTVIAWSLNTQRNIDRYENDSSSLTDRIDAAVRAGNEGYYLAFHFDPIIIYDGWKEDYRNIIDSLFQYINTDKIVWISLGCFRYSPGFKEIIRDNFPDEELTIEEMFPGIDGKMRYLKKNRIEIYSEIIKYINKYSNRAFIYLCMESSDMWYTIFEKNYSASEELEKTFSDHLIKNFLY
ncbi:MAG: DNA photolyase [Spirochaetota bacterium]|nr:DNA photolyase [Spirochaetota bacterium]